MPTRGRPPGISERVAFLEEQLRNLHRLPGAVVMPDVPAPVVLDGEGMVETMRAQFVSPLVVVGPSAGFTTVSFDPLGPGDSGGPHPPTLVPDVSSNMQVQMTAPGYHLCTVSAAGDSAVAEVLTLAVNIGFAGGVNIPISQDATFIGASGSAFFGFRSGGSFGPVVFTLQFFNRTLAAARSFSVFLSVSRIGISEPSALTFNRLIV